MSYGGEIEERKERREIGKERKKVT